MKPRTNLKCIVCGRWQASEVVLPSGMKTELCQECQKDAFRLKRAMELVDGGKR